MRKTLVQINKLGCSETFISELKQECISVLNMIHDRKIAVIDIQPGNIIINSELNSVCFLDFADSVICDTFPSKYFKMLVDKDNQYLKERVIDKLLLRSIF